jgi:hypothetical protein
MSGAARARPATPRPRSQSARSSSRSVPSPLSTRTGQGKTPSVEGRDEAWQANNLVFCHENGALYTFDALNWRFSKMTRKAGIGHWHAHEGRHTAVSILSSNGVPIQDGVDLRALRQPEGVELGLAETGVVGTGLVTGFRSCQVREGVPRTSRWSGSRELVLLDGSLAPAAEAALSRR